MNVSLKMNAQLGLKTSKEWTGSWISVPN